MMLQESLAQLRECGLSGNDRVLTAVLEAAGLDVNRAVNNFLDGRDVYAPHTSTASARALEEDLSPRALQGKAPAAGRARRDKKKKEPGASTQQEPEVLQRKSYAQLSQSSGHHFSSCVSIITSENEEHPTGVHYEAGPGESYDIDVLRMRQTHSETGSIRKIRREKKGVWRFDKKGSTWGVYPGVVSVELERLFSALDRRGAAKAPRAPRAPAEDEESPEDPRCLADPVAFALSSLDSLDRHLSAESLSSEALASACELLLSAAEAGGLAEAVRAGALLEALAARHGLRCDVGHVRRAALVVGSMRLLQAVLGSTPGLSLVGLDLFDRKYLKVNMQDLGRKNCVRSLLARGMQLGSSSCAPQGKLLRKVEADAAPAWAQRCLDSMMNAYPQMPDSIRDRVFAWLGLDA